MMGVSRAGYYKWLKHIPSSREASRETLIECVQSVHEEHRSHGYRWVAAYIRLNCGYDISDNFTYKIFRYLDIRSETKHKVHYSPRKERDKYPNLIFTTWETVDRPRQVIVSDMTALHVGWIYIELTLYFDVFTKQIVSYCFGTRRGDRMQYINGLNDVITLLEAECCREPVVLHTDQGSVYASLAYNELIKDRNIKRSMSRAGKPTDNPVNESLNGWINEELYMDFKLGDCMDRGEMESIIERYFKFYNSQRPCYSLKYDTPNNFYKRFINGEIEKEDTFNNRELSEVPKFVQKKLEQERA